MSLQNQISNDVELADLLALERKNTFLNMSCHHVGTIESFDASMQTATVTINYTKVYFDQDGTSGDPIERLEEYPLLLDCPVVFLGGGKVAMTFPVAKGDECLVLFNDRDFSDWFNGSNNSPPPTLRLHSFSDGIIIVGIRSLAKLLPSFSTSAGRFVYQDSPATAIGVTVSATGARLSYGENVLVEAKESKIAFKNASQTLKTLEQNLCTKLADLITEIKSICTALQALTVVCAAPGNPSSIPVNATAYATAATNLTAISTAIDTIKTNFGDLLE